MATRRARQRSAGASSSNLVRQYHPPWPQQEGTPMDSYLELDGTLQQEVKKPACTPLPMLDYWDDFDTFDYKAWLGVAIQQTRIMSSLTMHRMEITDECLYALEKIG